MFCGPVQARTVSAHGLFQPTCSRKPKIGLVPRTSRSPNPKLFVYATDAVLALRRIIHVGVNAVI